MWRLRHELRGFRLWQFVSRKFLRWLTLVPLAVALVASVALRHQPLFAALVALQVAFYAIALTGVWQTGKSRVSAFLRLPYVFLLANLAVLVGVVDACRQKKFATWNIAVLSRGSNPQRG